MENSIFLGAQAPLELTLEKKYKNATSFNLHPDSCNLMLDACHLLLATKYIAKLNSNFNSTTTST